MRDTANTTPVSFITSFLDEFPLHTMLTTLGKYMVGLEIDHSKSTPLPVLKLLFPSNWLIPEDLRFIVEADYFSDDETLYYVGPAFDVKYMYLDDVVKFADDIIKYNDAVEAKKLELSELLRQKELVLEQTIREHKAKMEAGGVTFRNITPKRPRPVNEAIVPPHALINLAKDPEPSTHDSHYTALTGGLTVPDAPLAPVVARKPIPQGFDPAIFGDDDEPVDPRELEPPVQQQYVQPQERVMPLNDDDDFTPRRPQGGNGGLTIVKPQPSFNRDQVIMQRHDRDDNY